MSDRDTVPDVDPVHAYHGLQALENEASMKEVLVGIAGLTLVLHGDEGSAVIRASA